MRGTKGGSNKCPSDGGSEGGEAWVSARRLVEMRAALDASLIAHGQTADESEGEEEDAAANSARRELNNNKHD